MKTLKLIAAGIILLVTSATQAQVSVNVNIGAPPAWGPAGYSSVEYYYLPDVQAYYDVRATQFIYFGGGRWIRSRYLPNQYRNYDLYNGYKVVLNDYKGDAPYSYHTKHRANYPKGYKGQPQKNRGEKPVKNNKSQGKQKSENKNKNNSQKQSGKDHDGPRKDRH